MRVLIDARKMGHGGIGRYLDNLISGLLSFTRAGPHRLSTLPAPLELTLLIQKNSDYSPPPEVAVHYEDAGLYSIDEMFFLARRIDWSQFDLFHAPHYTLPFGIPVPSVITVHDIIHIKYPERFFYPLIARPWISSSLKRAAQVISVSESSRRDVTELVPDVAETTTVIPNAYDPAFGVPVPAVITGPYFLAVLSNEKPHKGLPDLLAAWDSILERARQIVPEIQLILAGAISTATQARVKSAGIEVMQDCSFETLASLYQHARYVVVPSKYEGFCLPMLESHVAGTPVVCRPAPAVHELVQPGDILAADMTVEAFAEAMLHAVANPRPGKADFNLVRYSRETVARATMDIYHRALSGMTAPCLFDDGLVTFSDTAGSVA